MNFRDCRRTQSSIMIDISPALLAVKVPVMAASAMHSKFQNVSESAADCRDLPRCLTLNGKISDASESHINISIKRL